MYFERNVFFCFLYCVIDLWQWFRSGLTYMFYSTFSQPIFHFDFQCASLKKYTWITDTKVSRKGIPGLMTLMYICNGEGSN